ncbi:MAG: CaiB/BaiF CoA-transferase family protein [Pseudomonadota bacterium]
MTGPLAGVRVLELRGLGPGPYAGMLLGDLGADVISVERASRPHSLSPPAAADIAMRNKRSIALDLKKPAGAAALLRLVRDVDIVFEGFRPGVVESLGVGPADCHAVNPRLVYGRLTGWGQSGPLSQAAGHDINYIALTGVLAAIGSRDTPSIPLNLVGDYAGGSLFLVIGLLSAYIEAQRSGQGQVVDAAMIDGAASLMSLFHTLSQLGHWSSERGTNLLDGGAYNYAVYETADGKHVALGCLEPEFFAVFAKCAGVSADAISGAASSMDRSLLIADVIRQRTQAEWIALTAESDACLTPVLTIGDAPLHPHHIARQTYVDVAETVQPAPAPRFNRTPCAPPRPASSEGADTESVLQEFGFEPSAISQLRDAGVLR